MGTQGVPLSFPKSKIIEAIKRHKGVITYICQELNASHGPLLKYIKADPKLNQLLTEARNEYRDFMCDVSEGSLLYAVTQKEDLSCAVSAAKFVLTHQGKERGYSNVETSAYNQSETVVMAISDGKKLNDNDRTQQETGQSPSGIDRQD